MTHEEEILLLTRGIDKLDKQLTILQASPTPMIDLLDLCARKDNLVNCLKNVIFKHFGEREFDEPQIPHNPMDCVTKWGN